MALISHILMAGMAAATTLPSDRACSELDPKLVELHVEEALSASDLSDQSEALGLLHEYWETVCEDRRAQADGAVVEELAKLLGLPVARLTAASILVEIGPNLPRADAAVTAALKDQQRIERDNEKAAEPWVPSTGRIGSMSLECIARKIRTGAIDEELCQYIPGLRDD